MVAVDEKLIQQRKRKIARAPNVSCADYCQHFTLDCFAPSDLRGENNSVGAGGDSRCVGISAVGFGFDGSLNNTGLDQFGRVISQQWANSTGTVLDGYTYTYDQNSNVTSKTNVLDGAYSETYTNDNLNRLTSVTRGGSAYQSWNLDSQGNWSSSTTSGTTQTRTTNSQNQITSITGTTGTPQYDPNGNMITDQNGNTLKYDAWNRLVSVTNSSGQVLAAYTYNALSQRVTETYPIAAPGIPANTVKNLYYSTGGQILEERWGGTAASNTQYQYVWSATYVNAMILRDSFVSGTIQPDMRIYTTNDANYNVTSLVTYNVATQTWGVSERFVYSPYGSVLVFDASFTPIPDAFNWQYMYQGGRFDTATGLYHFGARNYSPSLGIWISQDPLQYVNGADSYQFVGNNPMATVDPMGLAYPPDDPADHGYSPPGTVDRLILKEQLADWRAAGDSFAIALLNAFLSRSYPNGQAGAAFERFAGEIKNSSLYRSAAQDYFDSLARKLGPGTHLIPLTPNGTAFNVEYYQDPGSDLMYALGGAHFGVTAGKLVVKKECLPLVGDVLVWHTEGLKMVQVDRYTFPPGSLDWRLLFPAYNAANELQFQYGFPAFSHEERWSDRFSGTWGALPGLGGLFGI